MKTTVCWCDWRGDGMEFCAMAHGADGLTLEGALVGTRGGRYGASYLVRTDAALRTREVRVRYVGGPDMHVVADDASRWRDLVRNAPIPTLDGCLDVDIGVTPATNTFTIKRLGLAPQQSQDIAVAYVPLPSQTDGAFLPQRADQRYTCLIKDRRYRYEGLFRNFIAELEIDACGLVIDYPETFRRLPAE